MRVTCPHCGQRHDIGIRRVLAEAHKADSRTMYAFCPHCRKSHRVPHADAVAAAARLRDRLAEKIGPEPAGNRLDPDDERGRRERDAAIARRAGYKL